MRILVTGREGQVARSLAERIAGHELVFVGRPELDLADAGSIERTVAAVHPALVISAAAYTAVDRAEDEPELAMTVNGEGPGVLARAAARIDAPVVHLSTDYVYDGTLDRPYREDDPVGPVSVYGATKLAGEAAVATSAARHVILRTGWVYSPFGSNFVRTMLQLAGKRDVVHVVEDQVGCPTSGFDIAGGVAAVIGAWREGGRTQTGLYHFAGSGEVSRADFARAALAGSAARGGPSAAVIGIGTQAYPTRAVRPRNSRLDCTRFEEAFGYRAPDWRRSLEVVLDRLIVES